MIRRPGRPFGAAIVAIAVSAVGLAPVGMPVRAQSDSRTSITDGLGDISCEVLLHDHDPTAVLAADAMLRSVVNAVSLSATVVTPSGFGRSDDTTLLALAAEALDRFRDPPDRVLEPAADRVDSVLASLRSARTGVGTAAGPWVFGPMRSWTVVGGTEFDVALGVCPDVSPPPAATVTVTSSNSAVLDDSAFDVVGGLLHVRTSPVGADRFGGPTGTTVTIEVVGGSGVRSTTSFAVSVVRGALGHDELGALVGRLTRSVGSATARLGR